MRTEIDGLVVHTGEVPGPLRAALMFRAGHADETFVTHGLTHLVEHLALSGMTPADGFDGWVEPLATVLVARGPDDHVRRMLHAYARGVTSPPLERLEAELGVLAAESAGRAVTPLEAELLHLHYGARGPGLLAYGTVGLRLVGPDAVRAHAARHFGQHNAALVLTRPLPGLEHLPLAVGERRRAQVPVVVPRPELPAQSATAVGGIAAGAELRAGPGVSVLAALLDRMAYTKLRHTYGLAYVVRCRPIVVGPHQRFVALVADVAEDVAAHAASMLVDDVTRLGEGGVTDEAVAVAKADIARRGAIDPLALLLGAARADLLTREGRTAAENLEAVERVGRGEVGALAAELARRLIVAVPSGANVHGLPTLRHVGVPGPGDGSMTLRPDRVEYADEQGGVEVYFARCAAALRQPDGSLALVGLDGQSLVVHPDLSDGGSQALVTVEQALDPALFVPAPGRSTEDDARERQVRASVPRRDGPAVGSPTAPGHVTWRRSGPD